MACQEPMLRSNQVLKQEEAQDLGFEGQDVAQYVKQQQKLDREEHEEGAVWRDVEKRQAKIMPRLYTQTIRLSHQSQSQGLEQFDTC